MADSGSSDSRLKGALAVLAVLAVIGLAGFAWVFASHQTDSSDWERQRDALTAEGEALKSEAAGLRDEAASLRGSNAALEEEIAGLHEMSEALQAESAKMMTQIEAMESLRLKESDAKTRLAELADEIAARERDLKSLSARLGTSQATIQRAHKKRELAAQATKDLDAKIAGQKANLTSLEQNYAGQREGLIALEETLRAVQQSLAETLQQLQNLRTAAGG